MHNEAFRDDVPPELMFGNDLAGAMKRIQNKTPQELQELSDLLVARVRSHHALSATIQKIHDHITHRA